MKYRMQREFWLWWTRRFNKTGHAMRRWSVHLYNIADWTAERARHAELGRRESNAELRALYAKAYPTDRTSAK